MAQSVRERGAQIKARGPERGLARLQAPVQSGDPGRDKGVGGARANHGGKYSIKGESKGLPKERGTERMKG